MEGILKVTPKELQSTATQFDNKGKTIKGLTDEMMNLVEHLKGNWLGDASGAYIGKFKSLQSDIDIMQQTIQKHVKDLNDMATAYDKAEQGNVTTSQSLSGNVLSEL